MMLYHAALRRHDRDNADVIEAVAFGYSGARGGKNGNATRLMQQRIEQLRKG